MAGGVAIGAGAAATGGAISGLAGAGASSASTIAWGTAGGVVAGAGGSAANYTLAYGIDNQGYSGFGSQQNLQNLGYATLVGAASGGAGGLSGGITNQAFGITSIGATVGGGVSGGVGSSLTGAEFSDGFYLGAAMGFGSSVLNAELHIRYGEQLNAYNSREFNDYHNKDQAGSLSTTAAEGQDWVSRLIAKAFGGGPMSHARGSGSDNELIEANSEQRSAAWTKPADGSRKSMVSFHDGPKPINTVQSQSGKHYMQSVCTSAARSVNPNIQGAWTWAGSPNHLYFQNQVGWGNVHQIWFNQTWEY